MLRLPGRGDTTRAPFALVFTWLPHKQKAHRKVGFLHGKRKTYFLNCAAVSATRLPNSLAVSRSPGRGPSSGDESDGLCAIRPEKEPTKWMSSGRGLPRPGWSACAV